MEIKVVELFAGVGGFRLGLEKASENFVTVWANQWEPSRKAQYAFDCYSYKFKDNKCVNEDIAKVKESVPEHDLLVGGFPCQDYSVAATGAKGIEGKKGVLWWEIRDIVKKRKPKYILLENVDRLLKSPTKQRGRDFGIILKTLNDLGYIVEWRVINAAEYGFVQRRRRVFIFASKKSTSYAKKIIKTKNKNDVIFGSSIFSDAFPCVMDEKDRKNNFEFLKNSDLVEISDKFRNEFWNAGICINGAGYTCNVSPKKVTAKTLKSIIEKGNIDEKYFLTKSEIKKFEALRGSKKIKRIGPDGNEYFYSEGAMSPYDDLDLPARTMLTSEGSVNRSTHIIKDIKTGRLRKLTPLECEKINGFGYNWTGEDIMPESFRYFCMGNALVVGIIEKLGREIMKRNQE